MKVYYSHSKKTYGTAVEAVARKGLEGALGEVLCPNRDIGEKGALQPYLDAIDYCDAVVCTEYMGHIGRGVYDEVCHALMKRKDVFVLRKGELIAVVGAKIVDPNDWAVRYGKLITKLFPMP